VKLGADSAIFLLFYQPKEFQESFQHPPVDSQIKFPIFSFGSSRQVKFLFNFKKEIKNCK